MSTVQLTDRLKRLELAAQTNKYVFSCPNASWAYNFDPYASLGGKPDIWKTLPLKIDDQGDISANGDIVSNARQCTVTLFEKWLVIKVGISSQKVLFFKLPTYRVYSELLGCLAVWQNLRQEGLAQKWNFHKSIVYDDKLHANDLLVCHFKMFGPLPKKKVKGAKVVRHTQTSPFYPTNETEGWFTAIGHLLPTGKLNILNESDGSLLYTVNVASLLSSEVREVHSSVLQSSNVLFVGVINELRANYGVQDTFHSNGQFIEGSNVTRILIDFELRIDFADWVVALTSVTGMEYIGNAFCAQRLRTVRTVNLEVIEASFNQAKPLNVYCELQIWGAPWFRTSIESNLFWKQGLTVNMPTGTNYFTIVIKTAASSHRHQLDDITVGTCFVTPNHFQEEQVLTKIPFYDSHSRTLGSVTINMTVLETSVLPYKEYRVFENMLRNINTTKLVNFVSPLTTPKNLESIAIMLLDVFQSLHQEKGLFQVLMKVELAPYDSITRNGNSRPGVFNTIFRGNSMLSKALEKYDIRVGQEYLEKLLGPIVKRIVHENLICDPDPKFYPEDYVQNYANLKRYVELLWGKIFATSNDLPEEMKLEWKNLRTNVELSVEPSDNETPLNAISAFVFLRFLCPAILNPQLFNLMQGNCTGNVSKTLTLLAKIMMVFSNRSHFQQHKDPSLMKLNEEFLDVHKNDMLTFLDRVTERKMDFNEKVLDLSSAKDRLQLNASNEVLNELPSTPYLIDKYLSLSKMAQLLYDNGGKAKSNEKDKSAAAKKAQDILGLNDPDFSDTAFFSNMMDDNNDEFNSILFKRDFSVEELCEQATLVVEQTKSWEDTLTQPESPRTFEDSKWTEFADRCINAARLDSNYNVVYDAFVLRNPLQLSEPDQSLDKFLKELESPTKSKTKRVSLNSATKITNKPITVTPPKESAKSSDSRKSSASGVFKKLFKRKS